MNLKSYIRGIGAGILVTAAVFLISGRNDKGASMSDAQIIARAKELGMVEATTVADVAKNNEDANNDDLNKDVTEEVIAKSETAEKEVNPQPSVIDEKSENGETEIKPTEAAKEEKKPTEAVKEETKQTEDAKEETKPTEAAKDETKLPETTKEEAKPAENVKEEVKPTVDTKDTIVVIVNPGDGSDTVSMKMFDAGLVDNAHEFDTFLIEHGYDKKITVGNHVFKKSDTKEEMGKNLVSSTK